MSQLRIVSRVGCPVIPWASTAGLNFPLRKWWIEQFSMRTSDA